MRALSRLPNAKTSSAATFRRPVLSTGSDQLRPADQLPTPGNGWPSEGLAFWAQNTGRTRVSEPADQLTLSRAGQRQFQTSWPTAATHRLNCGRPGYVHWRPGLDAGVSPTRCMVRWYASPLDAASPADSYSVHHGEPGSRSSPTGRRTPIFSRLLWTRWRYLRGGRKVMPAGTPRSSTVARLMLAYVRGRSVVNPGVVACGAVHLETKRVSQRALPLFTPPYYAGWAGRWKQVRRQDSALLRCAERFAVGCGTEPLIWGRLI